MVIDIIIPTFNSSVSLPLTLQSIINQSYKYWKCYLVDDGSTDGTIAVAEDFSKQDERITVLSRPGAKKGANTCRNLGWKKSMSDYIMFVDADDLLLEGCLENRAMVIRSEPVAEVLIFQTEMVNENGVFLMKFPCREKSQTELIRLFIEHKIQWQTMSPVWKRSFLSKIGGWNEDYFRLQDVELNIRALLHQPLIKFFPGASDTQYKSVELSLSKIQAALYGIQRLVEDFFNLLVHGEVFDQQTALQFKEAFVALAVIAVRLFDSSIYIIDVDWTKSFLAAIKSAKLNKEHVFFKKALKKISSRKISVQHTMDIETWYPVSNSKDQVLFTVILFTDHTDDVDHSLKSLGNQTLLNFEVFVLFNQSSSDFNISLYRNITIECFKRGKISLSKLLNQAKGIYVFLLSSSYTLDGNCLKTYYYHFKNRPNFGCAGSLGISIDKVTNLPRVINEIATPAMIKVSLLKENSFVRGPIGLKKSLLERHLGLMDHQVLANENFKLLAILSSYTKITLLPYNLFTKHHEKDILQRTDLLNPTRMYQLNLLHRKYHDRDLNLHFKVMSGEILEKQKIEQYVVWANEVLSQNEIKKVFNQKELYQFFDTEINAITSF